MLSGCQLASLLGASASRTTPTRLQKNRDDRVMELIASPSRNSSSSSKSLNRCSLSLIPGRGAGHHPNPFQVAPEVSRVGMLTPVVSSQESDLGGCDALLSWRGRRRATGNCCQRLPVARSTLDPDTSTSKKVVAQEAQQVVAAAINHRAATWSLKSPKVPFLNT